MRGAMIALGLLLVVYGGLFGRFTPPRPVDGRMIAGVALILIGIVILTEATF